MRRRGKEMATNPAHRASKAIQRTGLPENRSYNALHHAPIATFRRLQRRTGESRANG